MSWILRTVLVIIILVAVFRLVRLVRSQGKKRTKIIVGTLTGLFAIVQPIRLLFVWRAYYPDQWEVLATDIIGTVICGAISFACFVSAFTKGRNTRT